MAPNLPPDEANYLQNRWHGAILVGSAMIENLESFGPRADEDHHPEVYRHEEDTQTTVVDVDLNAFSQASQTNQLEETQIELSLQSSPNHRHALLLKPAEAVNVKFSKPCLYPPPPCGVGASMLDAISSTRPQIRPSFILPGSQLPELPAGLFPPPMEVTISHSQASTPAHPRNSPVHPGSCESSSASSSSPPPPSFIFPVYIQEKSESSMVLYSHLPIPLNNTTQYAMPSTNEDSNDCDIKTGKGCVEEEKGVLTLLHEGYDYGLSPDTFENPAVKAVETTVETVNETPKDAVNETTVEAVYETTKEAVNETTVEAVNETAAVLEETTQPLENFAVSSNFFSPKACSQKACSLTPVEDDFSSSLSDSDTSESFVLLDDNKHANWSPDHHHPATRVNPSEDKMDPSSSSPPKVKLSSSNIRTEKMPPSSPPQPTHVVKHTYSKVKEPTSPQQRAIPPPQTGVGPVVKHTCKQPVNAPFAAQSLTNTSMSPLRIGILASIVAGNRSEAAKGNKRGVTFESPPRWERPSRPPEGSKKPAQSNKKRPRGSSIPQTAHSFTPSAPTPIKKLSNPSQVTGGGVKQRRVTRGQLATETALTPHQAPTTLTRGRR